MRCVVKIMFAPMHLRTIQPRSSKRCAHHNFCLSAVARLERKSSRFQEAKKDAIKGIVKGQVCASFLPSESISLRRIIARSTRLHAALVSEPRCDRLIKHSQIASCSFSLGDKSRHCRYTSLSRRAISPDCTFNRQSAVCPSFYL